MYLTPLESWMLIVGIALVAAVSVIKLGNWRVENRKNKMYKGKANILP